MKFTPDRGRLHHRAAVLQAGQQHRHARRPPLERRRPAARRGRRSRTRRPPAGRTAELPTPVQITAGHDVRHVLLRDQRPLRVQPGLLRRAASTGRRCGAPATACRRQRRLQLRPRALPDRQLRRHQLLGRRRLRRARRRPDTRPPRVSSLTPAADATRVAGRHQVTVTFDEPIDPRHVNTGSILLKDDGRQPVTGPSPSTTPPAPPRSRRPSRCSSARPTPRRSRAAPPASTDLAGNRLAADESWTFSTAAAVPVHDLRRRDRAARRRGRRPRPADRGRRASSAPPRTATSPALRFYKQSNNTGTHVGHLWAADGTLLASATFTERDRVGWQNVDLPNPVAITKNTIYVASYYSPAATSRSTRTTSTAAPRRAPMTRPGQRGRERQRRLPLRRQRVPRPDLQPDQLLGRRDVRPHDAAGHARADASSDFTPGATRRPTSPRDATSPPRSTSSSRRRRSPPRRSRCTTRRAAPSPATVAYNAQTRTANLTPSAPLAYQTTYTATLKGGAGGVTDAAGNPLAADKTWTFTDAGQSPAEGPGGPILVVRPTRTTSSAPTTRRSSAARA